MTILFNIRQAQDPENKIKKAQKIRDLKEYLISKGYIEYKPGSFAKTNPGNKIQDGFTRFKFDQNVLRYESFLVTDHTYGPQIRRFIRLRSGYYGQLSITDKGIKGLER